MLGSLSAANELRKRPLRMASSERGRRRAGQRGRSEQVWHAVQHRRSAADRGRCRLRHRAAACEKPGGTPPLCQPPPSHAGSHGCTAGEPPKACAARASRAGRRGRTHPSAAPPGHTSAALQERRGKGKTGRRGGGEYREGQGEGRRARRERPLRTARMPALQHGPPTLPNLHQVGVPRKVLAQQSLQAGGASMLSTRQMGGLTCIKAGSRAGTLHPLPPLPRLQPTSSSAECFSPGSSKPAPLMGA